MSYKPVTSKGELTKQKLLDAAEQIFGEKGYYETSVVDITQKAEVAQGTFYKYFSSKKEIFDELVRELNRTFRYEIRKAVEQTNSEKEAQITGIRTFFKWVKHHRNLYSIVQQAILVDPGLYRWYYERIAEGYIKGLERAIEAGKFKALDTETMAYMLMGISQFIGMKWILWNDQEVPESVIRDMEIAIFEGIGAQN